MRECISNVYRLCVAYTRIVDHLDFFWPIQINDIQTLPPQKKLATFDDVQSI